MSTEAQIPILLLKTKSQPHDAYEEHFLSPSTLVASDSHVSLRFSPHFIPVLEHKQNAENLSQLADLLWTGRLKEKYGGMIFTSQRAVEAWADTVAHVESRMLDGGKESALNASNIDKASIHTAIDTRTNEPFQTDILQCTPFPLYTVGPATSRALNALVSPPADKTAATSARPHPFNSLNPTILGSHTGNGAALALYIREHYNTLQAHTWFTWYEAPRLPFIPLLGMGSENYSRRRLESSDPRLLKRPLLFLVGEQRRDIIPRTLMHDPPPGDPARIAIHEVEVYRTDLHAAFTGAFEDVVRTLDVPLVVVVVFSPQGSREMLRTLGLVDGHDRATARGDLDSRASGTRYVVVAIGPTTRDHLRDAFGFDVDVCAATPSPEGVRRGVEMFVQQNQELWK